MENKSVLIGTFVNKQKILSFLEMLKRQFKININKIFVYSIENNKNEYIVTFKATNKEIYLKGIKNATVLHVKNGCLFSINALNKFIEQNSNEVNHKEYIVDWNKMKDKLVILTNRELSISNIIKIEDKSLFFE